MTPEFRPAKVVDFRDGKWVVVIGRDNCVVRYSHKRLAEQKARKINTALASAVRERFKFVEEALEKIEEWDGLDSMRGFDEDLKIVRGIARSALERLRREFGS